MRVWGAALAVAALLAGCGSIETGEVIDKGFTPGTSTTVCSPVGKVTVCNPVVMPSCAWLTLRNGEEEGDICLDADEWDRYSIGDEYP